MYIDTTLIAKIILDFHQLNGTGVNNQFFAYTHLSKREILHS